MKHELLINDIPQVLVCQIGARHRYAVPRMLEDAGMLAALYTDSSSLSLLGRLAEYLGRNAPEVVRRLANRTIKGVPKEKVFSTDYPLVKTVIRKFFNEMPKGIKADKLYGDWLSERIINKDLFVAKTIYTMNCSNLAFVSYAKSCGCRSVIDVFMHPETDRIILEENENYPNFGHAPSKDDISLVSDLWAEATSVADILLCPSEWVASGICKIDPAAEDKIRLVPYGCTIDYGGRVNSPITGRIFFAGSNALIKGLPYLAQAASYLIKSMPDLDVRIAGQFSSNVVNHPLCKDLNFLGKLTSEQMKEEYLSADLFVLPTLTEGFAGVIAEAIGAGCPVVVTKESGSPIVHGREGFIVGSRNTDALIDAINEIVCDRNLRNKMSAECLTQAQFYSESKWQKRLIEAITL